MFLRKFAALLMFILCCSASLAFAEPTRAEIEKAEDHFRKGAEAYAQGDYAKAVVEFKFGNAIAPNAMFLYNMSLAYERLESFDEAIDVAQDARTMRGMPEEIAQRNEARIAGFYTILSARRASKDIASAAVARQEEQDAGEEVLEEPAPTVERPDGVATLGWVGIGVAAVGGGLAIGGFLTNSAVNDDIDELRAAASVRDEETYDTLMAEIPKKQSRGKLLYTIGGVAAGVGLALFVTDLIVGTETVELQTSLGFGADGANVGATLRF